MNASAHRLTGQTINFNGLLFGDRFRFVGDLDHTSYGPVTQTQDYVDGTFSVVAQGATQDVRSGWTKVVLLHRAPDCACGGHVGLCWNECEWPQELEDLWSSLYGG